STRTSKRRSSIPCSNKRPRRARSRSKPTTSTKRSKTCSSNCPAQSRPATLGTIWLAIYNAPSSITSKRKRPRCSRRRAPCSASNNSKTSAHACNKRNNASNNRKPPLRAEKNVRCWMLFVCKHQHPASDIRHLLIYCCRSLNYCTLNQSDVPRNSPNTGVKEIDQAVAACYSLVKDCYSPINNSYRAINNCYSPIKECYSPIKDCYGAIKDSDSAIK